MWFFFLLAAAAAGSMTAPTQEFHTTDIPNDAHLVAEATNGVGHWIWAAKASEEQTVHLWKTFDIPRGSKVTRATIWITADNGYILFLDGHEIGQGSDWRRVTQYDVTLLLKPGRHVLGVSAFNDALAGGLMFGLHVHFANYHDINVISDDSWRVVPIGETRWENRTTAAADWPRAKVVGNINQAPWVKWPMGVIVAPPLEPLTVYFWQTGSFQIILFGACAVAVLVCMWLLAQLAIQSKALHVLHLQRARIARDIHDDLGVRLTQLVLQAELTQNELPPESATRIQMDRICECARDLANAMDEVVWAVSSRQDTLRDFAAFSAKYAQTFLRNTPVGCGLDVEPDLPAEPIDLPIRRNLLLALKEAVSNVAKHSGATKMFLRIHRHNGGVRVVVEDNGRGFDPAQVASERNGLTNMAQRMREVGGSFVVKSMAGAGCRVEFNLPLTHGRRRRRWFSRFLEEPVRPNGFESPQAGAEGEQPGRTRS